MVTAGEPFTRESGGTETFAGGTLPFKWLPARGPVGLTPCQIVAEACIGCAPLNAISELPSGAIVNLTMRLRDEGGGSWLAGEPLLLAEKAEQPALRLADY